jgi:hypothetical protein
VAFKTFVAGAVLTASDVNTYLAKQAVIVCTSTTRPTSPPEGMVIYETDTDALLVYTTATTGWRPPWNMPWGRIESATGTSTSNIGTADVDINGMSVTWTAVQNRRYRVSAQLTVLAPSAGTNDCNVFVRISDGSNVLQTEAAQTASLVSSYSPFHLTQIINHTAATGSLTRKVRARVTASTSNSIYLSHTPSLLVEDIGPSAAPA